MSSNPEAEALIRKAIDLEPQNAAAYNNLGDILARTGSLESAINRFEEAIKLKSDLAEAHYNLALLMLRKGDREQSHAEFEKAHALDPRLKPP